VLEDIQIAGFGKSFKFDDLRKIRSSNPEYLPPEILEFIQRRQSDPYASCEEIISKSYPWSIDIWSLGVILLEIASGYPIWISNKCK
jgi:serine/threonine protein kinase